MAHVMYYMYSCTYMYVQVHVERYLRLGIFGTCCIFPPVQLYLWIVWSQEQTPFGGMNNPVDHTVRLRAAMRAEDPNLGLVPS